MEAIGTLAGGIAHDFNNLLQIILGYSDLVLLGQTEKDRGHKKLQAIRQAASRGADLVRQVLFQSPCGDQPSSHEPER